MTISAHVGFPGSGKSYNVVANVIIPALKQGRAIVHNLQLNETELRVVAGDTGRLVQIPHDADADTLVKIGSEAGAVVVIDEIWRYWPAGTKTNEVPTHQLGFFKEHRHRVSADGYASEIAIIDQELGSGVARFLRDLVEVTYCYEKLNRVGMKNSFRVEAYSRAQNLAKPQKTKLLRRYIGKYQPEIFNCYKSHTQSKAELGTAGLEQEPDQRGSLLKSWQVKASIAALVVGLPLTIWLFSSAVAGLNDREKVVRRPVAAKRDEGARTLPAQTPPTTPETTPQQQPQNPPSPTPAPPIVSSKWRIAGVVEKVDGSGGIALLISDLAQRRLSLKDHCRRDEAEVDYVCELNGELVTVWSGASAAQGRLNIPPGTLTSPQVVSSAANIERSSQGHAQVETWTENDAGETSSLWGLHPDWSPTSSDPQ